MRNDIRVLVKLIMLLRIRCWSVIGSILPPDFFLNPKSNLWALVIHFDAA